MTKELLSAVWNKEISGFQSDSIRQDDIWIYGEHLQSLGKYNIHELAHKVKEWAFELGVSIRSYKCSSMDKNEKSYWVAIHYKNDLTYYADSEPEAVFKAGQWVLEQRSKEQ